MAERKWTFFAAFIVHHTRAVGSVFTTLTMHNYGEDCLVQMEKLLATWYFHRNDRVHVSSILKPMEFAEMLMLIVHVVDPVF